MSTNIDAEKIIMHRQTEPEEQRREIYETGEILHNTTLKQVYTLCMIENEDCSMRVDPYVFIVHLFRFKWKHEVQQQCYCFA